MTPLWQLPKDERAKILLDAKRARELVEDLNHDVENLEEQIRNKRAELLSAKRYWARMIDTYGSDVVVNLSPQP